MFKKIFLFILIFINLLFFLKIDYRYKTDWTCCSDEFDYYSHIKTIVDDRDFDYSNQFGQEYLTSRNYINDTPAPYGFIGTSLLSLPFYKIGNILSELFDLNNNLISYEIAVTSLASTFYLYLTVLLFIRISIYLKSNFNYLIIVMVLFGSGITYYSFERYLMPHVFEVFTITLLIYLLIKLFITNNKLYMSIIPYAFLISFLVRWTNYHILFIPLIVKSLFFKEIKVKFRNKFFISNSLVSLIVFLYLNKLTYGIVTLNPMQVYSGDSSRVSSFLDEINLEPIIFLINALKSLPIILFGQEFGIFWFSPILFIGTTALFFLEKKSKVFWYILISFGFQFGIVILWGSTASSYGYRYLYSLIPLSFLIFLYFERLKFYKYYLINFSIFSFLSTLMFETSTNTQLSLEIIKNSFGNFVRYSQPNYLSGVVETMFSLNSWLIVISTSMLFSLVLKTIFLIVQKSEVLNIFSYLGLPIENEDFQNLINTIDKTPYFFYLIYLIFVLFISIHFLKFKRKTYSV